MKVGEELTMSLFDLAKPMQGRLVEVQVEGEEELVWARVVAISREAVQLKVVPTTVKE